MVHGESTAESTSTLRGAHTNAAQIDVGGVVLDAAGDPTLDVARLPLWPGAHASADEGGLKLTHAARSMGGVLRIAPPAVRAEPRSATEIAIGPGGYASMGFGDTRPFPITLTGHLQVTSAVMAERWDMLRPPLGASQTLESERLGARALGGLLSVARPFRVTSQREGFVRVMAMGHARRARRFGAGDVGPLLDVETVRRMTAIDIWLPAEVGELRAHAFMNRESWITGRSGVVAAPLTPSGTRFGRVDDRFIRFGWELGWLATFGPARWDNEIGMTALRFAPHTYSGVEQRQQARRLTLHAASDVVWEVVRRLDIGIGARIDSWNDDVAASLGPNDRSTQPSVHVSVEVRRDDWRLHMLLERVARPATFVERFADRGLSRGNPGLASESAVRGEVALSRSWKTKRTAWRAEVAYRPVWANDAIAWALDPTLGAARAVNVPVSVSHVGTIDLGAETPWLRGKIGYVARQAQACANATGFCVRSGMPGMPSHDLLLELGRSLGPFELDYALDVVAGGIADARGQIELPKRAIHTARIEHALRAMPEVRVGIEGYNLGDARTFAIRDVFGVAPLGRSVFAYARFDR